MTKIYVNKYSQLWDHTLARIENAKNKCTKNGNLDYEKFKNQMITRLIRIKHIEKTQYAIEALIALGYQEIAEIYDSKLTLDLLSE